MSEQRPAIREWQTRPPGDRGPLRLWSLPIARQTHDTSTHNDQPPTPRPVFVPPSTSETSNDAALKEPPEHLFQRSSSTAQCSTTAAIKIDAPFTPKPRSHQPSPVYLPHRHTMSVLSDTPSSRTPSPPNLPYPRSKISVVNGRVGFKFQGIEELQARNSASRLSLVRRKHLSHIDALREDGFDFLPTDVDHALNEYVPFYYCVPLFEPGLNSACLSNVPCPTNTNISSPIYFSFKIAT